MTEEKGVLGLPKIRRNRGISLEQISQSTKISVRCLEAIEQGDFGKLPGGIYNTSYIKQYARAIDYDESALLAVYQKAVSTGAVGAQAASSNGSSGDKGTFGGGLRTVSGMFGF
jgi:cytoskeletal protein RodZ